MNEIAKRLEELRAEAESGRRQLELLDRRRAEVRDALLRIAGAIEVLDELEAGERAVRAVEATA